MKAKILLLSFVAMLQLRCGDDNISPAQKTTASLWITITDVTGEPVRDAVLEIGNIHVLSDQFGHSFLRDIELTESSFLKVNKNGFFSASRRFYPSSQNIQNLQIQLLPLKQRGTFNASTGKTINVGDKSSLVFPENAVMNEDGSPYNGKVIVMAEPIYADDPSLSNKMPGDLTGADVSGNNVALESFGMLAVQLQDENGSKLQVATGKSVVMKINIPQDMIATAPSTIPMWYFDEIEGTWKEDGSAEKIGNDFVGLVSHFSFWNCDLPQTYIKWDASFVFESGKPVIGVEVSLTNLNNNSRGSGYTDGSGKISARIPGNQTFLLEIKNPCKDVVYSKEVGPFSNDASLGIVGLPESVQQVELTGRALDCNQKPVTKGYINVYINELTYVFNLTNSNGSFDQSFITCLNDDVLVNIVDEHSNLESIPAIFPSSSVVDAGDIIVCDSLDQFVRFKVTGFNKEYVFHHVEVDVNDTSPDKSTQVSSPDTIGYMGNFYFNFPGVEKGTYLNASNSSRVNLPNGEYGYVVKFNVVVTDFGIKGDFIRGSFSGQINAGDNGSGGPEYSDFAGTFAVRRN